MKSDKTAEYWKTRYEMLSHPEGGWYREIHRSRLQTDVPWGGRRNVSTGIVYLLENKDISSFHKIRSDELWHLYDSNSKVFIHCIDQNGQYEKLILSRSEDGDPCHTVPAGVWFAAELDKKSGSFAMMGCTVSPGFDFEDFTLAKADELIKQFPRHKDIIERFNK